MVHLFLPWQHMFDTQNIKATLAVFTTVAYMFFWSVTRSYILTNALQDA